MLLNTIQMYTNPMNIVYKFADVNKYLIEGMKNHNSTTCNGITFTGVLLLGLMFVNTLLMAQSTNDILNLMVASKTISTEQADSVRAEAAIKQQEADANKKSFFVAAARSMKLTGYTQIRYQNMQEPGRIDGADIRRARLDLRGNVTPYWSYQFQIDFAGLNGKLLDAVADFKPYDFLTFSIGQTKIPLSFENQISDNKMEAIDRSQVVEALVARSRGPGYPGRWQFSED